MVFQKVHSILNHSGVDFKLHYHDPVVTVAQAYAIVPHLTVNLIKTVVFQIKDGPWILAAVNGDDRIHYKYLADVFDVNRKLIRAVSPPEVGGNKFSFLCAMYLAADRREQKIFSAGYILAVYALLDRAFNSLWLKIRQHTR